MARRQRDVRHSIYDVMDAKGVFLDNPANADADAERDGRPFSVFPLQYPKMFYHPRGEMRITNPAEVIVTPLGPKMVNEHKELISAIAESESDEKKLRDAGWHDHPSKANAAAGREAAPVSSAQVIGDLQAEIARLQAKLNSESSAALNSTNRAAAAATSGPMTTAKAMEAEKLDLPKMPPEGVNFLKGLSKKTGGEPAPAPGT